MASKANFVAKHMNTFNRAVTHTDRKNDYNRSKECKSGWLDEYEEDLRFQEEQEARCELITEDLEES